MKKTILISVLLLAILLVGCEKKELDPWGYGVTYKTLDAFKKDIADAKDKQQKGKELLRYEFFLLELDYIIYPAVVPEDFELVKIILDRQGTYWYYFKPKDDLDGENEITFRIDKARDLLPNGSALLEGTTYFNYRKEEYEKAMVAKKGEKYYDGAASFEIKEEGTLLYRKMNQTGSQQLFIEVVEDGGIFGVYGDETVNLTYEEVRALCQYTVIPLS